MGETLSKMKVILISLAIVLVVGAVPRTEDKVVPEQEFVAEQEAAALTQQATLKRDASLQKLSDERMTVASVRNLIIKHNQPTVDQLLQDKLISDPQKAVVQQLMSLGSKYEVFLSWDVATRKSVGYGTSSDHKVNKKAILAILDVIKNGVITAQSNVETTYQADLASINTDYVLAIKRAQEGLDLRKFEEVTSGTCASHNMRQVPVQDCPLAARAVVNTIGADHQTQRGQGNIPDGCLYAPEIQQTYSKEATNLVQTTTSSCSMAQDAAAQYGTGNPLGLCKTKDSGCAPNSDENEGVMSDAECKQLCEDAAECQRATSNAQASCFLYPSSVILKSAGHQTSWAKTCVTSTPAETPGASDSFTCETQGNAEFDNDKCLQDSSGFGATDTCASSVGKCTSDSKDMHRCCSKACSVTAVCSLNVCNALAGAGDCSSLPLDCGVQVDGTTYNCLCETPFDISTKTPSCEPQGVCMGVSGLAVGSEVCYSGSTANSADTCKQLNDVNTDFCSANGAGSTHCIRPQTVAEATVVAQDQKEADTPLAEKKKEDSKALLSAESTAEAKIRAKLPNLSKEVTAAQLMQGTGELSQSLFSMGDKYHVQAMSTQQLEKIPVQELLHYVERAIGHKEDSIKSQSAAGMDLI